MTCGDLRNLVGVVWESHTDGLTRPNAQMLVVGQQFLACDASLGAYEREVRVMGEFTSGLETRDLFCQIGNALG